MMLTFVVDARQDDVLGWWFASAAAEHVRIK